MMGRRQEAQAALFHAFSLEDHVPQDHLLRSIDRFVDPVSICGHLADFQSQTGRRPVPVPACMSWRRWLDKRPSIGVLLLPRGELLVVGLRLQAARSTFASCAGFALSLVLVPEAGKLVRFTRQQSLDRGGNADPGIDGAETLR